MLVAMLGGCGAGGLSIANGTALGVSTATLACDWGQTRKAAGTGWRDHHDSNPVMGPTPSTGAVDAYFLAAIVLNAGIWYVMPKRLRSVIPAILTVGQISTISDNNRVPNADLTGCGVAPNLM